ncbi:MAG: aldehyde dehydrogenase family protein [Rhodoferax sp.]|nr:aldehyde dehydrogenase family protein [Rhodoferax sp.]
MYNTGQAAVLVERVLLRRGEKVYDQFVQAFVNTVKTFKSGDPASEDTYIGAITRAPQLDILQAQVDDAKAKGATLLTGGQRGTGEGNWFEPTVLSNVSHSMEIMREESFGPVIGIQKVSSDAEAVALMNDTRYGLTAGVFTPDEARAKAVLEQVNAGTVY